jgi:hypothetical protein
MTGIRTCAAALTLVFTSCDATRIVDARDYAFDTFQPKTNEVQIALERAQRYWAANAQRFQNGPRYLAVTTATISGGEIFGLEGKLQRSDTSASYVARGAAHSPGDLQYTGVMIWDTALERFVSPTGYVCADLPPIGSVARWGEYFARYIGPTGSF